MQSSIRVSTIAVGHRELHRFVLLVLLAWVIGGLHPKTVAAQEVGNDSWPTSGAATFPAGFVTGDTVAARLILPSPTTDYRLSAVRLLFGGSPVSQFISVLIWDDSAGTDSPGPLLFQSQEFQLFGSDAALQEIVFDNAPTVSGTVRVGLELPHDGLPTVGVDADGIQANLNYLEIDGIGWVEASSLGITGDLIIRAIVEEPIFADGFESGDTTAW